MKTRMLLLLGPLLLAAAAPDTSGRHSRSPRYAIFYAQNRGGGRSVTVGLIDLYRGAVKWKKEESGNYGGVDHSSKEIRLMTYNGGVYSTVHFDLRTGEELFRSDGRCTSREVGRRRILFLNGKTFFARLNPRTGKELWRVEGKPDWRFASLGENRIVIGITNTRLLCLDVESGKELWDRDTNARVTAAAGNCWIYTSGGNTVSIVDPATGRDKSEYSSTKISYVTKDGDGVLVTESDRVTRLRGKDARAVWSTEVGSSDLNYSWKVNETIVVMGRSYQKMWLLDHKSGRQLWDKEFGGGYPNGWGDAANDIFVVGWRDRAGTGHKVLGLNLKNGSQVWEFEGSSFKSVRSGNGILIRNGNDVKYIQSKDGRVSWTANLGGTIQSNYVIGRQALCTAGNRLVSLDLATGRERWSIQFDFDPSYVYLTVPRR